MNFLFKVKDQINKLRNTVPDVAEHTTSTLKEISQTTLNTSKELFSEIANKIKNIRALTELKLELDKLETELQEYYLKLGETAPQRSRWRKWDSKRKALVEAELTEIHELENKIKKIKKEIGEYQESAVGESFDIDNVGGEIDVSGYQILKMEVIEDSLINGKQIKEINFPEDLLVVLIKRDENVLLPDGQTIILAGDILTVIGKSEDVEKFISEYKLSKHKGKNDEEN